MPQLSLASASRQGSALVVTIVVISAIAVLTLASLQLTLRTDREARHLIDHVQTLYLAEAGLAEAATAILENAGGDIGSFEAPVRFGDGVFWVEGTEVEEDRWLLQATALSGSARVAVESLVEKTYDDGGIPFGLFTERRLKLKKKTFMDSWDSDRGSYASQAVNVHGDDVYAGSNVSVGTNEELKIEKDVKIFGDVVAGPDALIEWKEPEESHIYGDVTNADRPLDLPPVVVPDTVPSLGKLEIDGDGDDVFDFVLGPGELHYDDLKIKKKAHIKIQGPATIVVDEKLDVQGSIVVDGTNGPVSLYAVKKAKVGKNSTVATTSGSARDFMFLIGDEAANTRKKKGKAEVSGSFTGIIYAPDVHVNIKGPKKRPDGGIFGALLAYSIKQKELRFHFDESLLRLGSRLKLDPRIIEITWKLADVEERSLLTRRLDPFQTLGVEPEDLRSPGETWTPAPSGDSEATAIDWDGDFPWVED